MIDRRAFLQRLGVGTVSAAAAICAFDVEKLLWVRGEKTILIPTPTEAAELSGYLQRGDIITFPGLYTVSPVTGQSLPYLKQFVVTDDVVSCPVHEIPIWPPPIADGHYRNVTAVPTRHVRPKVIGVRINEHGRTAPSPRVES